MLAFYAKHDQRIKVNFREVNGNISEASNSALELASGEFVLLLDHDDCLSKEALYFLIHHINEHPGADIFYSDEDKIDAFGNRFNPHFKCSVNLDLLYSQNYVSHLGVYRRELLNLVGGFRKGYEGAQDYDILLRCLLVSDPSKLIHIPRILYHWRASEGSTALNAGFKSYTHNAGLKAISDHLNEKYIGVEASGGELPNTFRITWPIPSPKPMVSLIIPTRDRLELLRNCIESIIEKTKYLNYEILIVDNDSIEPETLEYFYELESKFDQIRILNFKGEFNYSAINNWAVNQARGEIVGLVNNDIEVISPELLTEMVSHAIRPEIGVVGAKLLYPDYKIQHAGVVIGIGGVAGHSHKYFSDDSHGYFSRLRLVQNYSAVTAACFLVRKEIFTEVGGLDQLNLKIAFNDIDFCLRVSKAGYRNLWTPYAKLFHHESISRGAEDTPEKQARFNQEVEFMKTKWGNLLQCDPFYSPNLTLVHEDFSLASIK
jgi:GT2 family glycosyltransferase